MRPFIYIYDLVWIAYGEVVKREAYISLYLLKRFPSSFKTNCINLILPGVMVNEVRQEGYETTISKTPLVPSSLQSKHAGSSIGNV